VRLAPAPAALATLVLCACGSENGIKRTYEPPKATILAPTDGQAFHQDADPVVFSGQVTDSYDRPGDMTVTWTIEGVESSTTADADGMVGFELDNTGLALGDHTSTLTVVDSDGQDDTATVTWTVLGPLGAPDVTITAPEDGTAITVGDSLTFEGEATDTATAADDLTFAWSSDLDGPLDGAVSGGGQSVLPTTALSEGTHTITLAVTDGDGEVGTASITVTVNPAVVVVEEGDLVFSEMMIDPQYVDDVLGEWVELYNTAGYPIDIDGYSFHDDDVDQYTLVGPIVVEPHDYVVLCADTDPSTNGGIPCDGGFVRDSTGNGLALANGPDEVVLSKPDGTEIDWLHYDETWYEPALATGLDPAFLDFGANDDVTHWCSERTIMPNGETGTPGAANDPCGDGM
jgi:hypothetical protein